MFENHRAPWGGGLMAYRERWLDPYSDNVSTDSVTHEDDIILSPKAVRFFLRDSWGEFRYLTLALLSGGLAMLFLKWDPAALVKLRYKETNDTDPFAELVLITTMDDTLDLVPILTYRQGDSNTGSPLWVENRAGVARPGQLRMFVWRQERY